MCKITQICQDNQIMQPKIFSGKFNQILDHNSAEFPQQELGFGKTLVYQV